MKTQYKKSYVSIKIINTHSQSLTFRVWHGAPWATMRLYKINATFIKVIEHLYDKANSAVPHAYNNSIREWFRTTVGVRYVCLSRPPCSTS